MVAILGACLGTKEHAFEAILRRNVETTRSVLRIAIATLGAILGVLVLAQGKTVFFYQSFTPEIVYFACGYGLSHPGTVPPKLLAFLARESLTFDCANLDPDEQSGTSRFFCAHAALFQLDRGLYLGHLVDQLPQSLAD